MLISRAKEVERENGFCIMRCFSFPVDHDEYTQPTRVTEDDKTFVVVKANDRRFPTVPSLFEALKSYTLGELLTYDKIGSETRQGASLVTIIHSRAIPMTSLLGSIEGQWTESEAIRFSRAHETLAKRGDKMYKQIFTEPRGVIPIQALWNLEHCVDEDGHKVRDHADGRTMVFTEDCVYYANKPEDDAGFKMFWPGVVTTVPVEALDEYVDGVWDAVHKQHHPPLAISKFVDDLER